MSATIINPAESFIGTASPLDILALVKDLRQDGRVWEELSIDQYLEDIDEWTDEYIIFCIYTPNHTHSLCPLCSLYLCYLCSLSTPG